MIRIRCKQRVLSSLGLLENIKKNQYLPFRNRAVIPHWLPAYNYYLLGTIWPPVQPETQQLFLKAFTSKDHALFLIYSIFYLFIYICYVQRDKAGIRIVPCSPH